LRVTAGGARLSEEPAAGVLWGIMRHKPGYCLVHLINLADQRDTQWNAVRTPAMARTDLELVVSDVPAVSRVLLLSPDTNQGRPVAVPWTQSGGRLTVRVARLAVWTVVLIALAGET
jgi:dextranase